MRGLEFSSATGREGVTKLDVLVNPMKLTNFAIIPLSYLVSPRQEDRGGEAQRTKTAIRQEGHVG